MRWVQLSIAQRAGGIVVVGISTFFQENYLKAEKSLIRSAMIGCVEDLVRTDFGRRWLMKRGRPRGSRNKASAVQLMLFQSRVHSRPRTQDTGDLPWEEWFSRGVFTIRRGVDYHAYQGRMLDAIRRHAWLLGKGARITELEDGFMVQVLPRRFRVKGEVAVARIA